MEKWYVAAKRADFNKWAEEFGISPVLARILRNRELTEETEGAVRLGVTTAEEAIDLGREHASLTDLLAWNEAVLEDVYPTKTDGEKRPVQLISFTAENRAAPCRPLADRHQLHGGDRLCRDAGDQAPVGQMRRHSRLPHHPFLRPRRGHTAGGTRGRRGVCPPSAG